MKLIRRCTLPFCAVLLTACASVQMPVAPEAQPKVVQQEPKPEVVVKPLMMVKADTEVTKDFALESIPSDGMVEKVSTLYQISIPLSERIVKAAEQNAYSDFPSRNDILAIIAVESSFNPKASHKGSKGLMQVHESAHKDKTKGKSLFNIEVNIAIGASILREYFLALGKNKKSAVLANNSGIGNYLRRKFKLEYYKKFRKQYDLLSTM